MEAFEAKMKSSGCNDAAIAAFRHNYEQLAKGVTGMIDESDIDAVESLPVYGELTAPADMTEILSKTAMLKLNGGLGTSMGLEKAKSLLPVKDGKTFLALIAEQVIKMRKQYGSNVKFVLMNSFSTSEDSMAHLSEKFPELAAEPDVEMVQNKCPKVNKATLEPAVYEPNPAMEWCPPGHGDIYPTLLGSGMMDRLLEKGIKYVFVSNSDNLGATLDLKLLNFFATSGKPFVMEVAERTESDKKGGHLCVRKSDGKFTLRESAMCPDSCKADFEDISKHKFFNTNNLWVNLEALKKTMDANSGMLPLPLIKNSKTVNPREKSSMPDPTAAYAAQETAIESVAVKHTFSHHHKCGVIETRVFQLETAMGSAIECFEGAGAVVVPRSRFAPVKTCSDLFGLRSDAYSVADDSTVVLKALVPPHVKLSDEYKLVDDMEALVEGYPSMLECGSLIVKGPVVFSPGIALKGSVTFVNSSGKPTKLLAGEYANTSVDVAAAPVPAATA